jgi:aspartyl-tRNA(Asn)/glutamyl-tRNA(Gln) amidotransferase subunit C
MRTLLLSVTGDPRQRRRRRSTSFWKDEAMPAIDRKQVLHVAHLARLELSDEDLERFGGQLNAILEAVSKVSELELEDVPPTSHPLDLVNTWAEDEPRPCLPLEAALANAPDRVADTFRVPPAG